MKTQKPVLALLMSFGAFVIGAALVGFTFRKHVFYSADGEVLPYHAIDSLLRSQYVIISPQGADTVAKYFDNPPVDLPKECRLIDSLHNLRGRWKGGILYIEFKTDKEALTDLLKTRENNKP